jgi:hypothetical protein
MQQDKYKNGFRLSSKVAAMSGSNGLKVSFQGFHFKRVSIKI